MSVTLRGKPVARGDAVYDLAYGPGVVRGIESTAQYPIIVAFLGRANTPYSEDGRTLRFTQATLYPEAPAVVLPAGGMTATKWRLFLDAIVSTLNA